jgi:site-specific DNA-cytosine methylase
MTCEVLGPFVSGDNVKVLVACEKSGVVRDAFLRTGHEAWSCDVQPAEPSPYDHMHLYGDVLDQLDEGWDLMIAHPPCTHLAVSGSRWFKDKLYEQLAALQFVRRLMEAPIARICIENPVGVISTNIRKPDQYIQPWQFGHDASKKTGLWLKNLPPLEPTELVEPRIVDGRKRWANQTDSGQNRLGPSPTRAEERSRTYTGIAQAMAEQWGKL